MNSEAVDKLEEKIEEAIADMFKKLPLIPSKRTMHLMAKAAVAIYEAAIENDAGRDE